MFEDEEIKDLIKSERSRGSDRFDPTEKKKWDRFARELLRAIDDKDPDAFWRAANDFGIEAGSARYERLRKLYRGVF